MEPIAKPIAKSIARSIVESIVQSTVQPPHARRAQNPFRLRSTNRFAPYQPYKERDHE